MGSKNRIKMETAGLMTTVPGSPILIKKTAMAMERGTFRCLSGRF